MRILQCYPNLSQGGMGSLYLSRAISQSDDQFHLVFQNDMGAGQIFDELSNVDYRVVRKDRFSNFLCSSLERVAYDEIRFTSMPTSANTLFKVLEGSNVKRIYEFHSSDYGLLAKEAEILNLEYIDEIWVPSAMLAGVLSSIASPELISLVRVVPNVINKNAFFEKPASLPAEIDTTRGGERAVTWVGQFAVAKGYRDFVRALSLLPDFYRGYMFFSGAVQIERVNDLMSEIWRWGVADRISLQYNVPQHELGSFYRNHAHNGVFVSTSLRESFGLGVSEALACGMPVAAYRLPALEETTINHSNMIRFAELGEIFDLAQAITAFNGSVN